MRRHYAGRQVEERRRGRNIPAILLGTLFTVGTIAGIVVFTPSHDEADMARASESQTSKSASPTPSATAATSAPASAEPAVSPSAAQPSAAPTSANATPDNCPNGDTSGSPFDRRCEPSVEAAAATSTSKAVAPAAAVAPAPAVPQAPATDHCPNGDYSPSATDGTCGSPTTTTQTVKSDNCPNGDFSGSPTDGSCGTPPAGVSGVTATVTSCTYDAATRRMDMTVRVDDLNNAGFVLYTQFGTYGSSPWPRTVGSVTYTDHLSNVPAKVACRAWVG